MTDEEKQTLNDTLDGLDRLLCTRQIDFDKVTSLSFFEMFYGYKEIALKVHEVYRASLRGKMIAHDSGAFLTYPTPFYSVPRHYNGRSMSKWPATWEGCPFPTYRMLYATAAIMCKNVKFSDPSILAVFLVYEVFKYYSFINVNLDDIYDIVEKVYGNETNIKESKHGEFKINKRWFIQNSICVENGKLNTAKAMQYARRILHGGVDTEAEIVKHMSENSRISLRNIAEKTGLSLTTIAKHVKYLQESGVIRREGSVKSGMWVVIEQKN